MAHDEALPIEAGFTGPEARLVLHLLRLNGRHATNAELMRGSGASHRATFFRAKANLANTYGLTVGTPTVSLLSLLGLTTVTGVSAESPAVSSGSPGGLISVTSQSHLGHPPVSPGSPPLDAFNWPHVVARLEPEVLRPADGVRTRAPIEPEPEATRDFLAEACGADRMDDSGEWNVRNSPKNARRAAQAKVLMDAFQARFNKPLTIDTARRWVQKSGDSAEEAYYAIDSAHMRKGSSLESPVGYIDAIIRKKGEEQGASRSVSVHSSESEDNYYRPPSAEYLAKIEKLRQRGLMVPDED